ncbi:arsenate reductase ArsC [Acidihalobacter ferrooxydans]|uniref:Phosphotyrosine protein phosphatase I domain-containing protein n=1 Tax=Acidihalobacter ferrooxydans TaxID=1765967 RepID=A0A1P8UDQ6_9GAMM|nr:arsenate reductase ArsC [Acidihalobacter ferrooxydans]APZ42001.1 hypothetical protein BW247_01880 [Acidihalobacter ferrooxydans]
MDRTYNVLFLCTGNSARSIMAEAILNKRGKRRFVAYSAGSQPDGEVNADALGQIKRAGLPTEALRSKSWDEFSLPDSPHMDFVFTVCDKVAGEQCPVWPGQPITAHWGIPDPAAFTGDEATRNKAMSQAFHQLTRRIDLFSHLPIDKLNRMALTSELDAIGRIQDADE